MSGTEENEEVIESGNSLESGDALSREALSVCKDTEWEYVYLEWVVKLKKLSKEAEANARKEQTVSSVSETTAAPTETTTTSGAVQNQEKQEDIDTSVPESPEAAFLEIKSILTSLTTEIAPQQQTWTIRLNGDQLKRLNRITLLRAPFFWAPLTNRQAEEAWRPDITTWEDLMNPKSLRKATREMKKMAKKERKLKKK